ncbi:MAG: DUF6379 domain-containing protein [Dorea sp.]
MDFQAYNNILICDDPIKNVNVEGIKVGYEFYIKYPSYRGAYLSCIEDLKFVIDDEPVDPSKVYFQLNGKQFLLSEIPECYKEYWFVRDKATVRVIQSGGIAPGEHTVQVYMKHRVPYTGYFGQYLTLISDRTKTLTAEGGEEDE